MSRSSPLIRALPFAMVGIVVAIGCNGVLGNEEGTARSVLLDSGAVDAPGDAPPTPGDAGESCDIAHGNKVCFGLCVKIDQPNTGCGDTSCAACDPKNVAASACKGGDTTISCAYDNCKPGFDNCDGNPANGCEASLGAKDTCGNCSTNCGGTTPLCSVATDGKASCVGSCPGVQQECNGSCVTFDTIQNCGRCGTKCERASATAACVSGACKFTCNSGTHACGETCQGDINPQYCGVACNVCPVPGPNMVATCESGACGATCANGFMDCDGNPANGCEYAGNSCPLQTGCVPMCTKLQACCNGVCQPLIAPCAHI